MRTSHMCNALLAGLTLFSLAANANWTVTEKDGEKVVLQALQNFHQTYTLTFSKDGNALNFNLARYDGMPGFECSYGSIEKSVMIINQVPLDVSYQCRGDSFHYFSIDESINKIILDTFKNSPKVGVTFEGAMDTIMFENASLHSTIQRL